MTVSVTPDAVAPPAARPAQAAVNRRRKLSLRTKLGFASGSLEEAMLLAAGAVTTLYYNQVLGVSPGLCGTAFLIAALADAITDPLVGAFSDGIRTRWGRRHPLMFVAALPVALLFYALYQPPAGLAEQGLFLWLTGCLVALGLAKDFYAIPHTAMAAELTEDYQERTSISGFSYIVGAFGGVMIGAFIYAVLFPSTPGYDNGLLNQARYPYLAILGALVCFSAIMICVFSTADQIPYLHGRETLAERAKRNYAVALRETWRNMRSLVTNISYMSVTLCWLVLAVSGGVLAIVGTYARLYGFGFTTEELAVLRFVPVLGLVLCLPLSIWLTRLLDKKRTVVLTCMLACVLVGLPYTLKMFGLFPANDSAWSLPLYLTISALGYIALPIVPVVINSQLIDVADEHELRTGNRAEGLIFSVRLFAIKATTGLGAVIAGFGLEIIKFPVGAKAATLDPSVINGLMFMNGPLYYLIVFSGVGIAMFYSIDRKRHEYILQALEARRAPTR